MSDHTFYAKGRSKGNERKVTVTVPQLLIGKAPTKQKRVKMRLTMGLSTQKFTGTPEWIAAAHEFVAKQHDTVTPDVDLRGMDLTFPTGSLFGGGKVAVPKCQMRNFSIEEQGDAEDPDVVLVFSVYAPFSTALWEYLGQMAGDEIGVTFEQTAAVEEDAEEAKDDTLELTAEGGGDEEDDDSDESEAMGSNVQ